MDKNHCRFYVTYTYFEGVIHTKPGDFHSRSEFTPAVLTQSKMSSQKITLTYFDFRGRSEAIRLLLEDAGLEYEDIRPSFEEWGTMKSNR